MDLIKQYVEWSATGIEALAVSIVVIGSIYGTVRFLIQLPGDRQGAYAQYKRHLGRMLLLVLELLVAADIIETVAVEATLTSVTILSVLVLVRTFLSWALTVEIEGRWPWESAPAGTEEA